jgi:hypothetical protein
MTLHPSLLYANYSNDEISVIDFVRTSVGRMAWKTAMTGSPETEKAPGLRGFLSGSIIAVQEGGFGRR